MFVGKIQENVSISFLIYCNPKDVTVKLFVNGSIANNNEKYVFVINEGVFGELNLTITITDLDDSDFSSYSVDVTNPIGKTEVIFSVTAESKSAPNHFLFDKWLQPVRNCNETVLQLNHCLWSGPPGVNCWMYSTPVFSCIYCQVLIFILSPSNI